MYGGSTLFLLKKNKVEKNITHDILINPDRMKTLIKYLHGVIVSRYGIILIDNGNRRKKIVQDIIFSNSFENLLDNEILILMMIYFSVEKLWKSIIC